VISAVPENSGRLRVRGGRALGLPASASALPATERELTAATKDDFVPLYKRPGNGLKSTYLRLFRKAKDNGADVGTNILLHGVKQEEGGVRPATRAEIRESVGVLRRMLAPGPPATATATAQFAATGAGGSLDAIAACESGGDPTATGGGGAYRGKYQFTYSAWQSVGGSGDPAAAPEAEQDQRAAMLLARSGSGQWPVCGQ
jgi:Transglycosylase-like domain